MRSEQVEMAGPAWERALRLQGPAERAVEPDDEDDDETRPKRCRARAGPMLGGPLLPFEHLWQELLLIVEQGFYLHEDISSVWASSEDSPAFSLLVL